MNVSKPSGRGNSVRTRRIAFAWACGLVTLLALSPLALCADDKPAGEMKEADKITLPRTYAPGHYEIVQEAQLNMMVFETKIILTMGVSAEKAADGNGMALTGGLARMLMEIKNSDSGELKTKDSDNPDNEEGMGPIRQLLECRINVRLSPDGKVLKTSGGETLQVDNLPPSDLAPGQNKETLQKKAEEGFAAMMQDPFGYCPSRPVSVGDTWKIHRTVVDVGIFGDGNSVEDANCVLARIETEGEHRVAVIRVDAVRSGKAAGARGTKTRMEVRGDVRVYLSGDRLCERNLSMDVSLEMPDDQQAAAAMGMQNISIKQRSTLTRKAESILKPIEPAAADTESPASKPAKKVRRFTWEQALSERAEHQRKLRASELGRQ